MNILNIGSLNIDYVYRVPHFVHPGETLHSTTFTCLAGGKGSNQSIALARAGANVKHIGRIGHNGLFLRELLAQEKIDVSGVMVTEEHTGHAIIQVNEQGENAIILYAGANYSFTQEEIDRIFTDCDESTLLLLQNEVNLVPVILEKAAQKKAKIFFNPAPFNDEVFNYPLSKAYCLIINYTEGKKLSGQEEPADIFSTLREKFPTTYFILTLGEKGVWCWFEGQEIRQDAFPTKVVDTTAAGDTFIGFFLACFYQHKFPLDKSLSYATQAASLCVSRLGAAQSIPYWKELTDQ